MAHRTDLHGAVAAVVGDGVDCVDCAVGDDAFGSVQCPFWLDHDAQDVAGNMNGEDEGNVCENHGQEEEEMAYGTSIADDTVAAVVQAAAAAAAVAAADGGGGGGGNECVSGPL